MSYIGQIPLPQATEERIERTATAGQTLFTGLTYVNGHISTFINGVKLDNADFTATDGTTVTLATGAAAGDTVSFVSTTQTSALVALPLKDSAGNNVLSESGSTVTLTADEANVGSNALVVDSSGNVGVGTSSPDSKIHSVTTTAGANSVNFQNTDSGGYGAKFVGGGGASNLYIADFRDYSGASKLKIDGSGTVKISNASNINLLELHNSAGTSGFFNLVAFRNNANNGDVGSIVRVNDASTNYNTSSDYRLKENITNITDGISRVKQLNPSRFNFIVEPDNTVDGFIAHEVSDVVPEAITGEKDAVNEDGSINPQGIDQSKLVPLLTAALQESIALIESQQSQIDALTTRIEALETT